MSQNNNPLCTVMIPTYNQSLYLQRAIQSALDQDYPNLEVLVSDDLSTDDTRQILRSFDNSRLHWHTNGRNLGRVANYRDLLYNHANGDWVVNLDGDDFFIDRTFLRSAMNAINMFSDTVIVFADRIEKDDPIPEIEPLFNAIDALPEVMNGSDYLLAWPKVENRIHHLTTVYNRKKALETGFYSENIISSDYESLFRLMVHGKIVHLPSKVAVWRSHGNNASVTKSVLDKMNDLNWFVNVSLYAQRQRPDLHRKMRKWLYRNISHRYFGFLLTYIRYGDRIGLSSLEKEIDKKYPSLRFLTLINPLILLKLMYHFVFRVLKKG